MMFALQIRPQMFCKNAFDFPSVQSFYISTFLLTMTYAVEALMRMRDRLHRSSAVTMVNIISKLYVCYLLNIKYADGTVFFFIQILLLKKVCII